MYRGGETAYLSCFYSIELNSAITYTVDVVITCYNSDHEVCYAETLGSYVYGESGTYGLRGVTLSGVGADGGSVHVEVDGRYDENGTTRTQFVEGYREIPAYEEPYVEPTLVITQADFNMTITTVPTLVYAYTASPNSADELTIAVEVRHLTDDGASIVARDGPFTVTSTYSSGSLTLSLPLSSPTGIVRLMVRGYYTRDGVEQLVSASRDYTFPTTGDALPPGPAALPRQYQTETILQEEPLR